MFWRVFRSVVGTQDSLREFYSLYGVPPGFSSGRIERVPVITIAELLFRENAGTEDIDGDVMEGCVTLDQIYMVERAIDPIEVFLLCATTNIIFLVIR
jgi:hypothetical protein